MSVSYLNFGYRPKTNTFPDSILKLGRYPGMPNLKTSIELLHNKWTFVYDKL